MSVIVGDVYRERAYLVAHLAACYPSWMAAPEDAEPGFRYCVYIDTPQGQMSWHVADDDLVLFAHVGYFQLAEWDGHSTEEKYRRLWELTRRTKKIKLPKRKEQV